MTPYIIIAIFSTIIGSFLNVCIYRIPNKESINFPGSKCGTCNTSLKPLDLVPILSYLGLRGKCRYCQSKVSLQYPLVEFMNGVLYSLAYHYFGLSVFFFVYSILFSILLTVALIDYQTMRIPNVIVIFGLIVGAGYLIGMSLYIKDYRIIINGLAGMATGGAIIGSFMALSLILFKQIGMGMGDLKLLAMIGLFIGSKHVLYTIAIGVILAGVYGLVTLKTRGKIPFGPFISGGAVIGILWGQALMDTYLKWIAY